MRFVSFRNMLLWNNSEKEFFLFVPSYWSIRVVLQNILLLKNREKLENIPQTIKFLKTGKAGPKFVST